MNVAQFKNIPMSVVLQLVTEFIIGIICIIFFVLLSLAMGEQKDYDFMFKVILIGAPSVGKSKIFYRYLKGNFFEESTSTVGVEYATTIVTTTKGNRIRLQIWDTAGQQTYKSLMKIYYKGSSAALLVYDITKQKTFDNLDYQIKILKEVIRGDILTMIVGNKADLQQERKISKKSGLQFAQDNRFAFYETSAKDGTNIDLIFTRIAQELQKIVDNSTKEQAQINHQQGKPKVIQPERGDVIVLNKNQKQQRKQESKERKKCCQ